jgi:hypothetical protein
MKIPARIQFLGISLFSAIAALAQNECTKLGYQALDNLVAQDSKGVLHQVLCWNPNAKGGQLVFPGGPASSTSGPASGSLNRFLYVDGETFKTVQSAISAACDGTKPGRVIIPPGTFVGSFTPLSNCVIEGSGIGITIIQASASQNSVMIPISGLTNLTLKGFSVDGDCANPWPRTGPSCSGAGSNNNFYDLIQLTDSSYVTIDAVEVRNMRGNGIKVQARNSHIDIRNSIADFFGDQLPSVASVGFFVASESGAGSSHVRFLNDTAYSGNQGFALFPSTATAKAVVDITYESNKAYSNGNDGFQVFSAGITRGGATTYAAIQGLRYINNEAYCNGWTGNPSTFNQNCLDLNGKAGLLQTGEQGSSSGEGFDLNSAVLDQPQLIGNRSHDNFGEGFDNTPQIFSTVSCNGTTTVSWVGGDPFNSSWKPNQGVFIKGKAYLIRSVNSANKTITLKSNCSSGGDLQFVGVGYDRATVQGNVAYNNGRGSPPGAGHGFADISYGSTYVGNISYLNNAAGFYDQLSAFVTHNGDKAFDNNVAGGGINAGFFAEAALNPTYIGVTTDDSRAQNFQSVPIFLDGNTTGAFAESASLCNFKSCDPSLVADHGNSDTVSNGRTGNRR